jgi:hypothetical protein
MGEENKKEILIMGVGVPSVRFRMCEELILKSNVCLKKLHDDFSKYFEYQEKQNFKEIVKQKQKIPKPEPMPMPKKKFVKRHY